MDIEKIDIINYENKNPHFKKLLDDVLAKIPEEYEEDFPPFSIYEGPAINGAHVYEDYIMFDVAQLNEESGGDSDVLIGVIAHELAHVFCKHVIAPYDGRGGLNYEDEADQLASEWGFAKEIEIFRRKLGPAEGLDYGHH